MFKKHTKINDLNATATFFSVIKDTAIKIQR